MNQWAICGYEHGHLISTEAFSGPACAWETDGQNADTAVAVLLAFTATKQPSDFLASHSAGERVEVSVGVRPWHLPHEPVHHCRVQAQLHIQVQVTPQESHSIQQ